MSSLGELLAAHGLVKVQLNAVNSDVHAVGHELADGTGMACLQCASTALSPLESVDRPAPVAAMLPRKDLTGDSSVWAWSCRWHLGPGEGPHTAARCTPT